MATWSVHDWYNSVGNKAWWNAQHTHTYTAARAPSHVIHLCMYACIHGMINCHVIVAAITSEGQEPHMKTWSWWALWRSDATPPLLAPCGWGGGGGALLRHGSSGGGSRRLSDVMMVTLASVPVNPSIVLVMLVAAVVVESWALGVWRGRVSTHSKYAVTNWNTTNKLYFN